MNFTKYTSGKSGYKVSTAIGTLHVEKSLAWAPLPWTASNYKGSASGVTRQDAVNALIKAQSK